MPAQSVDRIGQKMPRITLGVATEFAFGPITIGATSASTWNCAYLLLLPTGSDVVYHTVIGQAATDGFPIKDTTNGKMIPVQDGQTFYLYSTLGTTVDIIVYPW
jgi:hypothetical protein